MREAKVSSSVWSSCMAARGNRVLVNNALLVVACQTEASVMTDLDPKRFTLRQAAQARDDFAQIIDELDFVKAQLARLSTRKDQAFVPLRIMLDSAILSAGLVILWFEAFWRHGCKATVSHQRCTHRS